MAHCIVEIYKKLAQLGFQRKKVEWHTAWSVNLPGNTVSDDANAKVSNGRNNALAIVGALGVPIYLAVGGFD